ncbi:hypothetical protein CI238_01039 [Colletotrichum incanum]|uniref:Uncharacterized protein n=1 Tax=Colletotrichum incanum TaxID=1573173 RepID=A0A166Q3A6_COLIC|nr:hypothetical protein CI238_01039 [Colletotrichum incanum]
MPFDFKAYDAKCNGLTPEELQKEWEHYTRLISGASTSTAISGMAVPFTFGVSTIGVAMAAPAIHNARKKREIIERHLQKYGMTHLTRKRDVLGSMAVSGTIGVVTLGVGTAGADAIATAGAEHGISAIVENDTAIKVVTHAALDGVGLGVEHAHTNHLKKKDAFKAFQAAGVFQAVQDAKSAQQDNYSQPQPQQHFQPIYQHPPQYHQAPQSQSGVLTGSVASEPSLHAPNPMMTYNPAYQCEKQSYQSMTIVQQTPQHPTTQQQANQTSQESQHYDAHLPHHQYSNQVSKLPAISSQFPAQVQQAPPSQSTSTYTPPTPLQAPSAYIYQQHTSTPAAAYRYSAPPPPPPSRSAQSYQPVTLPPPPPYPPPTSNTIHIHPTQQQIAPEPQYAPVPIPPAYNQTPNHAAHQQHPPAPVQQGYQHAPQSYQPQSQPPMQQQTHQQQFKPLPTPVSPPHSVNAVAQGGSSYFPAMGAPQNQVAYNPQKWAEQPYGQEPYTPAATPGTQLVPQVSQTQSSHSQNHTNGNATAVTPMSRQVTGYGTG